jgi:hypothetical protein
VRVDFDYFWLCALEPPGSASAGLPFSPVQPVLDAKRSLRCGCSSRWLGLASPNFLWMDWTDQHGRATSRDKTRHPSAEMVASAALVEFDRSDLCKGT